MKIKLTKFTSPASKNFDTHSWPLFVMAEGTEIDSSIFVYQHIPGEGYVFRNIASVHDMEEIPRETMRTTGDSTFFRSPYVELACRNPDDLFDAWEKIKTDTRELVKNYALFFELKGSESVTFDFDPGTNNVTEADDGDHYYQILQLSSFPAGTTDSGGGIETPDDSLDGWLPVDEFAHYDFGGASVPQGAVYFYNTNMSPSVKEVMQSPSVYSVNFLINGEAAGTNVITYDKEAVFWMDNANNPWPDDFQDRGNPGTNINNIKMGVIKHV